MHSTLKFELRANRAIQAACQQIATRPSGRELSKLDVVNVETRPSCHPSFLSTTFHGTVGLFSSGWPVAYLVATVIFGIGLLIGSVVHVSQPQQVARQSVLPSPVSDRVGRSGPYGDKWIFSPSLVGSPAWSIAGGRGKGGQSPFCAKHPKGRSGKGGLSPFSPCHLGRESSSWPPA